jgi:hypothetical protein
VDDAQMSVTYCLEVIHSLTSRSARERRKVAGMLYIWIDSGWIDRYTRRTLSPIVAWAALTEEEVDLRADLLDALVSFTVTDDVSPETLGVVVSELPRVELTLSEQESIATLELKIDEHRSRDRPVGE